VVYNSDVVLPDYSRGFRKPKWGSAFIAAQKSRTADVADGSTPVFKDVYLTADIPFLPTAEVKLNGAFSASLKKARHYKSLRARRSEASRIGRRSSCNLLVWARSQLELLFPQVLTRVHMH
jgi:hypothetical protein